MNMGPHGLLDVRNVKCISPGVMYRRPFFTVFTVIERTWDS